MIQITDDGAQGYGCGKSRFVICQLAEVSKAEASVMDHVWSESNDVAAQVLNTNMIQDLISGTLDPQQLTYFLVDDVYYVSRAPKTYLNSLLRTRCVINKILCSFGTAQSASQDDQAQKSQSCPTHISGPWGS